MTKLMQAALRLMAIMPLLAGAQSYSDNNVWYNARHGDADAMNQVGAWYYSGNRVDRDYGQAYYWWRQGALHGNTKSIANLGVCLQHGLGVERDSVEAMRMYLAAIDGGQKELLQQRAANTPASVFDDMLVGVCYERGIGVDRNLSSAAEYYNMAAERGSVDGMRRGGDAMLASGKAHQALGLYEQASTKGDMWSKYMVGKMRLGGMGVNPDRVKAVANIRAAAEGGVPEAQTLLGTMYLAGNNIPIDQVAALNWLQRGAAGGDAEGMWQYGMALKDTGDYDNALFWLSMAAQAGQQQRMSQMFNALGSNDPFRAYVLGMRHYLVDRQPEVAANLFKSASRVDAAKVMESVVMADLSNRKANPTKAARELQKLAESNPQAAYQLAEMCLNGVGADRDSGRAVALYCRAANAGYAKAQDALAGLYYSGVSVPVDRDAAIRLYSQAYEARRLSAEGLERLRAAAPEMAEQLSRYSVADPVTATLTAMF